MGSAAVTRQRLIRFGRAAFAAKGYDGVNLDKDILKPARVSTGSFYHQFADKTELLIAILEEASQAAQQAMSSVETKATSDDIFEPPRLLFEAWFDIIDAGEDLFRISLRERDNPDKRVRDLVRRVQRGWVASVHRNLEARNANYDLEVDLDVASRLIAALGQGILIQYLDTTKRRRKAFRRDTVEGLSQFTVGGLIQLADLTQRPSP